MGMLIYACADLIFATKIRAHAEAGGVVSRPVRNAAMLTQRLNQHDDGKANQPVDCLMVDLDLGADGLAMIGQVKQFDASIRVIAFGAHVAKDMLNDAKSRGADLVLPRSAFTAQLDTLVKTGRLS